jgi:ankyrin repeat protein
MGKEKVTTKQIQEWIGSGANIQNPKQSAIITALNQFLPKTDRDLFLKTIENEISEQDFLKQIQLIRAIKVRENHTIRKLLNMNINDEEVLNTATFASQIKTLFPTVSKYLAAKPIPRSIEDDKIENLTSLQSAIVRKNPYDVKKELTETSPVEDIKKALFLLVAQTHNDPDIGPIQNTLTALVNGMIENKKNEALNAKNQAEQTLLMLAIKQIGPNPTGYGNLAMVNFLIKNGADVNAVDKAGNTALMLAAKNGNITLLLQNKDKAEAALKDVDVDIVKLLLDNKADVNVVAKDGTTALMLAAEVGNTEIVKSLLDKGANANITRTQNGEILTDGPNDTSVKITRGTNSLNLAISSGNLETVRLLLPHVSKEVLNTRDNNGMTPLMIAAKSNNTEMVNALLSQKYSISEDKKLTTCIDVYAHQITDNKHTGDADDILGDTALTFAVKNNNLEMVKSLLDNSHTKEMLRCKDIEGHTPFRLAAGNNSWEQQKTSYAIQQLLVEKLLSIDPNAKVDKETITFVEKNRPVMFALVNPNSSIGVSNAKTSSSKVPGSSSIGGR